MLRHAMQSLLERPVGWNRYLVACARSDDLETAEHMFQKLQESKCCPSASGVHALATLYARRGQVERCAVAGTPKLESLNPNAYPESRTLARPP